MEVVKYCIIFIYFMPKGFVQLYFLKKKANLIKKNVCILEIKLSGIFLIKKKCFEFDKNKKFKIGIDYGGTKIEGSFNQIANLKKKGKKLFMTNCKKTG